jgi:hypothetical protein
MRFRFHTFHSDDWLGVPTENLHTMVKKILSLSRVVYSDVSSFTEGRI